MNKTYLFSIDLEDVRLWMPNGLLYKERVPANTLSYLNWLDKHNFKCTFFTVGDIAKNNPDIIKQLVDQGHEIAAHSNKHITLDKLSQEDFRQDLSKNIELLMKAGAPKISGFRAPVFSLTEKTQWAYDVLTEFGITYSSSVLPAKSPLFGWPEFGETPRVMKNGILEIPMTVGRFGPLNTPFGGGVYFRMLPFYLIKKKFQQYAERKQPVLGYFHPYDIDLLQEKFMHPGINNSRLYNYLMYYNRKEVFNRLDKIIDMGFKIDTYQNYVHENFKNVHDTTSNN